MRGITIEINGQTASGKTTIARKIKAMLSADKELSVVMVDGQETDLIGLNKCIEKYDVTIIDNP